MTSLTFPARPLYLSLSLCDGLRTSYVSRRGATPRKDCAAGSARAPPMTPGATSPADVEDEATPFLRTSTLPSGTLGRSRKKRNLRRGFQEVKVLAKRPLELLEQRLPECPRVVGEHPSSETSSSVGPTSLVPRRIFRAVAAPRKSTFALCSLRKTRRHPCARGLTRAGQRRLLRDRSPRELRGQAEWMTDAPFTRFALSARIRLLETPIQETRRKKRRGSPGRRAPDS